MWPFVMSLLCGGRSVRLNLQVGGWGIFLALALSLPGRAQVAVQVGAGAYAAGIPGSDQYSGGYYSMSPQQVVDNYTNLHLSGAVTNRPIPSNQWWTDLLVGDRSYQPSAGAVRVFQQNAYGGQLWAYPAMVVPGATGFSLFFPNAWNSRSSTNQPEGGFSTGTALPVMGSVPLGVGSNDVLLADFDGTSYPSGWTVTGTAFGTGPISGGTWPGEVPAVQGFLGGACVNTYRGADSPQGTLTSPAFTVTKKYLHVLAGGGNDTNNAAVWFMVGTNVVYAATGKQSGTLYWNTWDVSAYVGQSAKIKIVDTTSGSWGFILCSWVVASDDGSSPAARYNGSFAPVQSVVTDWSDWGVQFGLPDALGRRMDVTLARGVPFVWTTCTGVTPVIDFGSSTLYDTNGTAISAVSGGNFTATAFCFDYSGRTFGVFAPDKTMFLVSGTTANAQISGTSNYLVYGLMPSRTNLSEFASYAYARVTGTQFDWSLDTTNGLVRTSWTLTTSPLKGTQTNTLQGFLPHQYRTTSNSIAWKPYSYLTPRGMMKVAAGNRFDLGFNFRGIAPMLPAPHLNNLTNDYAASRMSNYITAFAASHPQHIADTYYGGKDMAITAQHMEFARQMGMTNQAAQLAAGLRNDLTNWFSYYPGKTSFLFACYDNWRALIGFPADFGSEAFNDNHFHYGYFALASALLGQEDASFTAQYGGMARLVAKQYANWERGDTNFPLFRTFDIWEGHSWAGGFSSGGGNNQESSSEAMNSWVGLFLLGNTLGDDAMRAAGAMGYAVESSAMNEYWQDLYRTNLPASYGKGMTGILTSGGVAYATYFNGDPAWIHGIQWVPANYWNNYLARDKSFAQWQLTNMWYERTVASQYGINAFTLTDSNNATALGGYLGNYVLGFQMLFDPAGVAAQMDAGYAAGAGIATDSTYSGVTYYLTHALRGLGDPDPNSYTSQPASQVFYNAQTGVRTVVVYNASTTNQAVTVYYRGSALGTMNAAPGALSLTTPGYTNRPTLALGMGTRVSWPTVSGNTYEVQWASNGSGWSSLLGGLGGDGSTNSYFNPDTNPARASYRVLERTASTASGTAIVSNGGFELGSGTNAYGWAASGSQPPVRTAAQPHAGAYAMDFAVTNPAATPNNSFISAKWTNSALVAGQSYVLSWWAKQISSGVSYVQNYRLSWLNSSGGTLSSVGWNGFSGGNGAWSQIVVSNLVVPTNIAAALLEIYGTTGAVQSGYGEVLIDDVALGANTPGQTNVLAPVVEGAVSLSWVTESAVRYQLQSAADLGGDTWTNLGAVVTGDGGSKSVVWPMGGATTRFYRVKKDL
jgi:endoglucanase Acf2